MSDDLVKRLRQPWDANRSIVSQTGRWMVERKEAADRIEELEAKLAKAVEALQELVFEYDEVDLAYDEPKSMTAAYGVALDTLAELTGGKDE